MALTKAQLAWCAAIFTAGTVTPPAVQKIKTISAKPKGERALLASRPRVVRPEPAQSAPHPIMDCPMPSVPSFDEGWEYRLEPDLAHPFPPLIDTGGGGVWGFPRPPAAVPELDTWVMLVAGFGLVGLSMRKRKERTHEEV